MKRLYLSDTVAGEISNWISTRQLKAGDQLPSASEWMARLEVGRSTLREGLKKLEAEGIIEVINGKGIFVSEQKTFQLLETLGLSDAREHLLEMLDVRQALEERAIVLATRRGSESAFAAMAAHLDDYRKARAEKDFLGVSEADAAFHLAIYEACGNSVLVGLIKLMHDDLYVSWDSLEDRLQVFDASFDHHVELLEGMRRRDEPEAVSAFGKLIEATRRTVEAM
ncbi:FCD domain-containing protein [Halomonas cupida]|uniref:FadR/GntR family transcriptional regulator n=1 Tax=Halomonas cupida TaxID=44933 RepID=UPI0039B3B68F